MTRVPITTLLVTTLALPLAQAWASGPSESVRRLMEDGRTDVAQAKCERLNAHFSDTPKALRDVCAEAMFEAALDVNTVGTWIRFQQVWQGTPSGRTARDQEAAAALRDLGNDAEDYRYAHDEEEGYAAGENYFPEALKDRRYYHPVDRGLEQKIQEKLQYLRERDKTSTIRRYD